MKKFCPECQQRGWRSTINVGMSTQTLMNVHTWYDEEGNHHIDNPNKVTTEYSCSQGHRWKETS